mmetsp:Transcript_829/g.3214  ORF Transcript_829/g.3214 Transcript_829/m.3214 type:complete len:238 (+) Transcript_829:2177-2890(+)
MAAAGAARHARAALQNGERLPEHAARALESGRGDADPPHSVVVHHHAKGTGALGQRVGAVHAQVGPVAEHKLRQRRHEGVRSSVAPPNEVHAVGVEVQLDCERDIGPHGVSDELMRRHVHVAHVKELAALLPDLPIAEHPPNALNSPKVRPPVGPSASARKDVHICKVSRVSVVLLAGHPGACNAPPQIQLHNLVRYPLVHVDCAFVRLPQRAAVLDVVDQPIPVAGVDNEHTLLVH